MPEPDPHRLVLRDASGVDFAHAAARFDALVAEYVEQVASMSAAPCPTCNGAGHVEVSDEG